MNESQRATQHEEPKVVRAWRWKLRTYAVTQDFGSGPVVDTLKTTCAIRALRRVDLIPGAKVKVSIPIIVQARRAS